ncbi:MAG: DUF2808 domain-containing protein [Cyanobacteria bacterium]|nr:DUF2808 domain-containing protein [Cyanobacteria bacterium CG_2015-16_32_12]NCO77697.1 DUF2808 domain-containing protein [Cyanobacteria bacterium CG_2015-22_32_23]NCQ04328.1 DUF2808 domain-containing protein [Cyanobacteria bacterium CG_2015-09_32_10]NCQ41316.1 DUF2808 domain-containing protein [Cyanobacteria bacterium CG_2015-04_32_10]NCS83636.1 DUF2808 domain-containing protein [Cyanobacteria bacterium CG_2015-02_32_10]
MFNHNLTSNLLFSSFLLSTYSASVLAEVSPKQINFFLSSPRLTRAVSTFTLPNVISTYIFEIEIPENAGNNLQKIVINQQINTEIITFFPEKTKAYIINSPVKSLDINTRLNVNGNTNEIIIDLLSPVKPTEKVKLAIQGRNPLYGGIYQFGVTVYPQGNNPQSLYLGIGRFHFDTRGDRF